MKIGATIIFATILLFGCSSAVISLDAPESWSEISVFPEQDRNFHHLPDIVLPLPKNSSGYGNKTGITIIEKNGIMFDVLLSKFFDIGIQQGELGIWSCDQTPGKHWKQGEAFVDEILLKCSEDLNVFYPEKMYKLTIEDTSLYVVPTKKSTDEDLAKIRLSILNAEIN